MTNDGVETTGEDRKALNTESKKRLQAEGCVTGLRSWRERHTLCVFGPVFPSQAHRATWNQNLQAIKLFDGGDRPFRYSAIVTWRQEQRAGRGVLASERKLAHNHIFPYRPYANLPATCVTVSTCHEEIALLSLAASSNMSRPKLAGAIAHLTREELQMVR
jgi:hypothetical protein